MTLTEALKDMTVDDDIDQGVTVSHSRQGALTGMVNAQLMGLTIDTLNARTLAIHGTVRVSGSVGTPAQEITGFDVELDNFGTRRTAKASLAVGIVEPFAELEHGLVMGRTQWAILGVEGNQGIAALVERDSGQTVQFRRPLVDVPGIKGGIGDNLTGRLTE